MEKMKKTLLWLWQLPQNVIGWCILHCMKERLHSRLGEVWYWYRKGFPGGITLGEYIILGSRCHKTILHEYGHVRQSRMLGPLYLLVIGLPSIVWAWLYGWLIPKTENGYYRFWTEAWADRLGGVRR